MKLQNLILGLAFMIISLIICVSIAIDMYSPENYDVNLSEDESTKALYTLQEKANEGFTQSQSSIESIRLNTPGQNGTDINAQTGLTEYDMQKSATTALADTHTFLDVFAGLITTIFNGLDLSSEMRTVIVWFIGLLIAVPFVIMLINSFLKNPV